MKVAVIYGSKSDREVMKGACDILEEFGIEHGEFVMSAHRIPEKLEEALEKLQDRGCEIFIAGAGLAAHLPGVVASKTTCPVIGVPINCNLGGLDALLSIVQMPKGIPVATVGINNSKNAAMLSVQMLALKYPEVSEKLKDYRKTMKEDFIKNSGLEEVL